MCIYNYTTFGTNLSRQPPHLTKIKHNNTHELITSQILFNIIVSPHNNSFFWNSATSDDITRNIKVGFWPEGCVGVLCIWCWVWTHPDGPAAPGTSSHISADLSGPPRFCWSSADLRWSGGEKPAGQLQGTPEDKQSCEQTHQTRISAQKINSVKRHEVPSTGCGQNSAVSPGQDAGRKI